MLIEMQHKPYHYKRARLANGRVFVPHGPAKRIIGWEMRNLWSAPPINGPFEVNMTFVFEQSATMLKKSKGITPAMIKTPDIDNLFKFYLDAGLNILWEDDRFCVKSSLQKIYGPEQKVIIEWKGIDTLPGALTLD